MALPIGLVIWSFIPWVRASLNQFPIFLNCLPIGAAALDNGGRNVSENQSWVSFHICFAVSIGTSTASFIYCTRPPVLSPLDPLVPNTISLNLSVSDTNPSPAPIIKLVVTPNGPPRNIAAAPKPILGSFCSNFFFIFPIALSSPNNCLLKLSLLLANPTADPTRIPAIGPPGTNGSTEVIPPIIAPFDIFGKYLWIFFLISLPRTPPLIDSLPSSSTIFSPNNHFWSFLLLDNNPKPEPTAAPSKGPPANPNNVDNANPVTPPAAIFGRYLPKLDIISFTTSLPSDIVFSFLLKAWDIFVTISFTTIFSLASENISLAASCILYIIFSLPST